MGMGLVNVVANCLLVVRRKGGSSEVSRTKRTMGTGLPFE